MILAGSLRIVRRRVDCQERQAVQVCAACRLLFVPMQPAKRCPPEPDVRGVVGIIPEAQRQSHRPAFSQILPMTECPSN